MSDVSYRPLIDEMVWSYTRVDCFNECRYRWFLRYIKRYKETPQFYSSYGSFMHKIIERYYKGELAKDEMSQVFLKDFAKEVQGERPAASTVESYIQKGLQYLKTFEPFPYNMIAVEKRVEFDIDGTPFMGFIDYLGEKDGEYYIVDNKSRDLKPRSKRAKPTVKDKELDEMLKQLYLYAAAVKQEYGKFPKALCFNCFKAGEFIVEPFDEEVYQRAILWAKESIEEIKNADDFYPNREYFGCRYICGVSDQCCYY